MFTRSGSPRTNSPFSCPDATRWWSSKPAVKLGVIFGKAPRRSRSLISRPIRPNQAAGRREALQTVLKWTPNTRKGGKGKNREGVSSGGPSYPICRALRQTSEGMVFRRGVSNLGGSQSHRQGTGELRLQMVLTSVVASYICIPSLWEDILQQDPREKLDLFPRLDIILFLSGN